MGPFVCSFLLLLLGVFVFKVIFASKPNHFRSLCGKHVLITDASIGIGFALAKRCLSEGAFVTLAARNKDNLMIASEKLVESVGCCADRILLKAVDVTDSSAVSLAINESFRWRPVDILICNAAVITAGNFDAISVKDIDSVIKTNVLGSVYPIHAVLPLMKTRSLNNPSSIVLIGSLSGLLFVPVNSVYTPSKYALKGLAELLRIELLPYDIRVNLVCPGVTLTPMLDKLNAGDVDPLFQEQLHKLLFYSRKDVEDPDRVAAKTIEGVKRGNFLITTSLGGFFISVLARGFLPAESLSLALIEMIFILPMRILSFLWMGYIRIVLQKESDKNLDVLKHPEDKPRLAKH